MRRGVLIGQMTVLVFLLAIGTALAQQAAPVSASPQNPGVRQGAQQPDQQSSQQGWYCPWCGNYQGEMMNCYGMGPGMMYGYGQHGMMHGYGHGYSGMGPGMMGQGYAPKYGQQGGKPLTDDQVKSLLQNYVENTRNPNLKVGKITKPSGKDFYVAAITTKEGSLVDKIDIDEHTGWFRSEYAR